MPSEIASLSNALVFLLLLLPGYFLVEVLWGRKYWFRGMLERCGNATFDKLVHYVCVSVMVDVFAVYLIQFSGQLSEFSSAAEKGASGFVSLAKQFGVEQIRVELFFLVLNFSILVIVLSFLVYAIGNFPFWILGIFTFLKSRLSKKKKRWA